LSGLAFGFATLTLTLASVPKLELTSAEQVELQDAVSEIKARKTPRIDFDSSLSALSARERLYREDPRSILSTVRKSRVQVAQRNSKQKTLPTQSAPRSGKR
jgi:hypothetical protein